MLGKSIVNHSKLFKFITVLGAVFVTIPDAMYYLSAIYSGNMQPFLSLLSPLYLPYHALMLFFIIGGPVFLTVGILGIGRQYFKNHRNLFTIFTFIFVPLFDFALFVLVAYSIPLQVAF